MISDDEAEVLLEKLRIRGSTPLIQSSSGLADSTNSDSAEFSGDQSSDGRLSSATSETHSSEVPEGDLDGDNALSPGVNDARPQKDVTIDIQKLSEMKGFILFGVHGSRRLQRPRIRMVQIDVEQKDDDGFFNEITQEYKKLRGYMRWIFSIWSFHTCEFIRVLLTWVVVIETADRI